MDLDPKNVEKDSFKKLNDYVLINFNYFFAKTVLTDDGINHAYISPKSKPYYFKRLKKNCNFSSLVLLDLVVKNRSPL